MKIENLQQLKNLSIIAMTFLALILGINMISWGQNSQTFTSDGTFTVPAGVTSITVECWGGGGAGGGTTSNWVDGGGGGAGGAYAKKVLAVTPDDTYTVTVAGTTAGANSAGAQGGPSWFGTIGTVYAEGGAGGAAPNGGTAAGGTGSSANSIGEVIYAGGDGANGTGSLAGAGGGGAGSTGAGGNASGITAGTGTANDGGDGGNGRTNEGNGYDGSTMGGGGGGAMVPDWTNHSGGDGAAGQVVVSWTIAAPPVAEFSADNFTPLTTETVTFTDESTNTPTSWAWTFTPSTVTYISGSATSQHPQVQFDAPGLYTVSLVATNAYGSDTETKTDYINASDPPPPAAEFSADNTTPLTSETVTFTDESTNSPTGWAWIFTPSTVTYMGGTTSASQNPQVQFDAVGLYTVELTATNSYGSDTETKTDFIDVTSCTVTVFPYTQTFDSWTASSDPGTSCSYGDIPLEECWTNESGDDVDWLIYSGSTPSGSTGPGGDHTGSGNYLYRESSGGSCQDATAYITSPPFDFSTLTDHELTFWYHMYGQEMGSLSVQVSTDGGSSWSGDEWSLSGDQGNSWLEATIDLSTYDSESSVIIRWTGVTGNGYRSDMAIDDVTVDGSVPVAPTANFTADNTTPAVGETVNFTDLSSDGPTSWAWAFSPTSVTYTGGTNSSSQNPQVQFNASGYYTVTLTATNAQGSDDEVKTNYILAGTDGNWTGATSTDWATGSNWENLSVPGGSDDITIPSSAGNWPTYTGDLTVGSTCGDITMEGSAELTVTGNLTINSGNTLTCANSTVKVGGDWTNKGSFTPGSGIVEMYGSGVSNIEKNPASFGGGKASIGSGGNYSNAYLTFDCTTAFILKSVLVRNNSGSTVSRTFYWSIGGTQQNSITVDIPSGDSRVDLDFNITVGTGHRLGCTGNLYRDNSGVSYPYAIGSVGSVTGSQYGTTRYYYCYDWEYELPGTETFNDLTISKSSSTVTTQTDIDVTNDFTVMPGAYFTNGTGNTLSVTGDVSLEADATGMASFIDEGTSTVGGTSRAELYLTQLEWHLLGIPVSTATAGVFHLSAGNSDIWLYPFDESINSWGPSIVPVATPLQLGQGYSCYVNDNANQDETVVFTGTLNNSDYTTGTGGFYGMTFNSPEGFNLLSNPYTSALQGNLSSWTTNNVADAIWVWDGSAGNYLFWGAGTGGLGTGLGTLTGGIIPSMQAFFVKATGASPSITIPKADRTHNSQGFYKNTQLPLNTLRLDVEGNGYRDALFVRFDEMATEVYDENHDIHKMYGADDAPQIYTLIPENKLSVNSLPELEENKTVVMGFECDVPGSYTFSASAIENFEDNVNIHLEDLQENTIQNLNETPVYTFENGLNADPNRFLLHFGVNTSLEPSMVENSIDIYSNGENLYVKLPDHLTSGTVIISNLLGQKVMDQKISGQNLYRIKVPNANSYYVVYVSSGNHYATEKVFIR